MNTMKEFISKSHLPAKLIRSTVRQCGGWDNFKVYAEDIAEHGAASGWIGFTYYYDTISFAKRNKKEILESIEELASSLGEYFIVCLSAFNCLEEYTTEELADGLYNPRSDYKTTVYNALAWYALEEVARSYADLSYNEYCD